MRCLTLLSTLIIAAALVWSGPVQADESTTHRITGGTFGVAWIASEGLVYTWSPTNHAAPFRVNHLRAHQVAAIDFDGDHRDELAIIDALNKSLYIYDFDDQKMIGPFGNNVAEITVGRFHPSEPFESLVAATYSGDVFRWNRDVGDQGWIPLPGDFVKGFRGKVLPRSKADGVVTVARGDVYTLNPIWKTYTQVLLGKDARLAMACDLAASPGDEIVVGCGPQHDLSLCHAKAPRSLGQQAMAMTHGRFGTESDALIVVTPTGTISRYVPDENLWKELPARQAWSDAILQDVDGDGNDELFAVAAQAPEELYRFDAAAGSFSRVPHQLLDVWGKPSRVVPKTTDKKLIDSNSENVTLDAGKRAVCDCKFWNTTHKPYVIRMYTPSGRNLLRDSPADHIHHHGLMFALSANDCDFWAEFPDQPQGKQELTELSVAAATGHSHISRTTATLLWKNADGAEILQERRTLEAVPYDAATLLTWSSELSKKPDAQVTLGGSHYFGLGMRFVESMDNEGVFRFSRDQGESTLVRGDERVTRASWAAYTAKLENGEPATAVIFSHPDNLRPMYAFTMGDNSNAFAFLAATLNLYREPYQWNDNTVLKLRWGIALFDGNPSAQSIDDAYTFWMSANQ